MVSPTRRVCIALACAIGAGGLEAQTEPGETPPTHRIPAFLFSRFESDHHATREVTQSVARALDWLVAHQDDDGRWDSDGFGKHDGNEKETDGAGYPAYDVGVSALALLALMADGHFATEDADSLRARAVGRGLKWLARLSNRGELAKKFGENWRERAPAKLRPGFIGSFAHGDAFYGHLVATQAILEGYALTGDPELLAVGEDAVRYVEAHRNPYGAWRYQPRDNDNDTSVTAWASLALFTARGCGLEVSEAAVRAVDTWIGDVTDTTTGRIGYIDAGGGSARIDVEHAVRFPREKGECTTAVGLCVRTLLDLTDVHTEIMERQVELLDTKPPEWNESAGTIDLYYWFFGSHAMRQVDGRAAAKWQSGLEDALVEAQIEDGPGTGSWDPIGVWGKPGGRVMATALGALCLLAESRYVRVADMTPFRRERGVFRRFARLWRDGSFGALRDELTELDRTTLDATELQDVDHVLGRIEATSAAASERLDAIVQVDSTPEIACEVLRMARELRGLGPGLRADALVKNFRGIKELRGELRAYSRYLDILDRWSTTSTASRKRKLGGLLDAFPKTRAAEEARLRLARLRAAEPR